MLIEQAPVRRHHLADGIGHDADAAILDGGEGLGHVDQPNVAGAEHHRGIGGDGSGNTEPPGHVGDRAKAQSLADLRADGVDRPGEGLAQADRAKVRSCRVARRPAVDRHRLVDHRILRLHARLQRGEIDEQLPRRSWLTLSLGRPIVDGIDIVAAADHRADGAVTIERHQRTLRTRRSVGVD